MKTPCILFNRTSSKRAAFSLVEVVLALGIFVFAQLSLLGLGPLAMSSARSSLDMATAVQLADGLASQFAQTRFSSLPPSDTSKIYYYDELGKDLTATVANDPNAPYSYSATVSVSDDVSSNLKNIKITVTQGKYASGSKTFCYLLFNQGV